MADKSIGALWKKQGNLGEYYTGNVEIDGVKHKLVFFKNGFKEKETQPDFMIYKAREKQQEETTQENDDDLPF